MRTNQKETPYELHEELVVDGKVYKDVRISAFPSREEAVQASHSWSHPDHNSMRLSLVKVACGCFEESHEVLINNF